MEPFNIVAMAEDFAVPVVTVSMLWPPGSLLIPIVMARFDIRSRSPMSSLLALMLKGKAQLLASGCRGANLVYGSQCDRSVRA